MARAVLVARRGSLAPSGVVGPFTPASIAGLQFLWAADALALADNAAVTTWADSSSHARTLTASANGTYKTGILNGLPVVRLSASLLAAAASATFRTVLAVVKYNAATFGGYHGLLSGTGGSGNDVVLTGSDGSANWHDQLLGVTYRKAGGAAISPMAAPMAAFAIVHISLGGGGWTLTPQVGSDRTYGGAWDGDVAEIVGYDTVLSLANLDLIGDYLADKYALTWAAAA